MRRGPPQTHTLFAGGKRAVQLINGRDARSTTTFIHPERPSGRGLLLFVGSRVGRGGLFWPGGPANCVKYTHSRRIHLDCLWEHCTVTNEQILSLDWLDHIRNPEHPSSSSILVQKEDTVCLWD